MTLDDACDEAAGLLREVCRTAAHTKRFDDLAREYVTAQANYTNMLRDWEHSEVGPYYDSRRSN